MLGFVIALIIVGAIAGFIARLLIRAPDAEGFGAGIVLCVIGSFIGGLAGYVLFGVNAGDGELQPSGILGSFAGAAIAMLVYRSAIRSWTRV